MQGIMARNRKGTVDQQIYSNVRIALRSADPSFGGTVKYTTVNGKKVKVDRIQTIDNGKTWTIRQIVIPAMNPRQGTVNERLATEDTPLPSERTIPKLEDEPEPEWVLDAASAASLTREELEVLDALAKS
jgi:hypothetical protein